MKHRRSGSSPRRDSCLLNIAGTSARTNQRVYCEPMELLPVETVLHVQPKEDIASQ